MTFSLFQPRRLLWVDAQPTSLESAQCFLQAQGLTLRLADCFEAALDAIRTWMPHLLLLDYTMPSGAMPYETFVYAELPELDPYRPQGPLAANPWQHSAIPILLVAGAPMTSVRGYVIPHLTRAAHFLPKPCEPCHLVHIVHTLLPEPDPGLILDQCRGCVQVRGVSYPVSPGGMELLLTLARHHPRPLTASELVHHMYEDQGISTSETNVRMTVHTLRRVLETDPAHPQLLRNERRGYFLSGTLTLDPA